jgi:seryl-tRNA synthetase
MFDIKWIRAHADAFDKGLQARKAEPQAAHLIALDDQRREAVAAMNEAQEKRNALSKQIGQAKAQKDEAKAQALMADVAALKTAVQQGEEDERRLNDELTAILQTLPNTPLDDVPVGEDEDDNAAYNADDTTRPAKPSLGFTAKEHFDLGEAMGLMDFEQAAKISGSRFVLLKGQLARMERALGQFMLDLHANEHGYTEVQPPLLVRDEALLGTGQLPKFEEDLFFAPHGDSRLALIPTAEVPLTNLVREAIVAGEELPLRFTALTPCFRSEAGSAGRDTRGMLRQHQFNKVEMVSITTPETSNEEHERMLACAEEVLKRLDIHYRVMTLCTGDMGFGAQRTWDIEAWMPGQDTYREISSVSVCGDFQARRMNARYRDANGKPQFVHTLNGSGVAVGRALIAVMENYQQADGSIAVPEVLQPYMGGLKAIGGPA